VIYRIDDKDRVVTLGLLAFKRGYAEWSEGDRDAGDKLAQYTLAALDELQQRARRWADQATSPAQRHVRSLPRSAGKIVSDESQLHGCLEAGVHASDRRPRLAAATPGRLERATYRRERKVT
jgi:hypothetical protein